MNQTKNYKYGDFSFKTNFKSVGRGWEISLHCFGKPYFVSNFVNRSEANLWWRFFNAQVVSFAKKYWCTDDTPQQWYCNFLANHMYKTYYSFLDKIFVRHNKVYNMTYKKDVRKYMKLQRHWERTERFTFNKRAA